MTSSFQATLLPSSLAAIAFLVAYVGTRGLVAVFSRHQILAHPDDRSSHASPIPVGGGIAVLAALLPVWLTASALTSDNFEPLLFATLMAFILAVISWVDDLRGLKPLPRLCAQAIAIGAMLTLAPFPGLVFGGLLSPAFDLAATMLIWLWFINLFNFMDGIDGLVGVETAVIGLGIFVAAKIGKLDVVWLAYGLSTAGAAIGFLRWNWHPARIFLGDVGSVPLGFLLGWLLLGLAASGHPAPALILPAYFVGDATITLLRRLFRGERILEPHRDHFYQLAVRSGLRHDQIVGIVAVSGLFMIALTMVAMRGLLWAAVSGAMAATALLLFLLAKGGPTE